MAIDSLAVRGSLMSVCRLKMNEKGTGTADPLAVSPCPCLNLEPWLGVRVVVLVIVSWLPCGSWLPGAGGSWLQALEPWLGVRVVVLVIVSLLPGVSQFVAWC